MRDAVYRILKAEGLGRLLLADRVRRSHSRFKEYDLGFVHVDVKHLPKLRTQDGQSRKRYLYVAIDAARRSVHPTHPLACPHMGISELSSCSSWIAPLVAVRDPRSKPFA